MYFPLIKGVYINSYLIQVIILKRVLKSVETPECPCRIMTFTLSMEIFGICGVFPRLVPGNEKEEKKNKE